MENLTGDQSLDWISAALGQIVASDLTGAKGMQPVLVRSKGEIAIVGATRAVLGYYSRSGGTLRVHAGLRDVANQKTMANFAVSGPVSGGVVVLGNSLAKSLNNSARSFGTNRDDALRALAEAAVAPDPATAGESLEKAVAADPNFGEAWLALIERQVLAGQTGAAQTTVQRVRERGNGIREFERARIDWFAARASGDSAAQAKAVGSLARLMPGDTSLMAAAAEAENNARRFSSAVAWYKKAVAAEPANVQFWNQLLYSCAYDGDANGVKQAFDGYLKASPNNANAWDSLGEAAYYLGKFDEAEKDFLESNRIDPAFLGGSTLQKAAHARRMTGDLAKAGELFGRFLAARKQLNDPLLEYHQARWEYVTGQEKAAVQRLDSLLKRLDKGDAAALCAAQLAAWKIASGELESARVFAARATALSVNPAVRIQSFLCLFASQPKVSPAEWRLRGERVLPGAPQTEAREVFIGYALVFSGEFEAAAPVLKAGLERSVPSMSGEISVPLAWAWMQSGKREEAKSLLRRFPVPSSSGERVFDFLDLKRAPEIRRMLGL
jgi:tetratricopeptide (TPR) repeat protein